MKKTIPVERGLGEPKPYERLLTDEDNVFINEITKRCCGASYGTIHAEIQYTALHFQSKTARPAGENAVGG